MSRAAELQDYFQDDCVATVASHRGAGALAPGTAVIYPIAFPDRLELLLETSNGLKQVRVPVAGKADERNPFVQAADPGFAITELPVFPRRRCTGGSLHPFNRTCKAPVSIRSWW